MIEILENVTGFARRHRCRQRQKAYENISTFSLKRAKLKMCTPCLICFPKISLDVFELPVPFNLLYTGGLFHYFMLKESICHFRGVRSILSLSFHFLMENPVSKQVNSVNLYPLVCLKFKYHKILFTCY